MPIDTEVTDQMSFEVIDPIDAAPIGSTIEQYVEEGVTQLVQGGQTLDVTFITEKASADYLFDEKLIYNLVDASPLVIGFEFTDFTTTGFQILLNAKPDNGNYYFKWKVRIPTASTSGSTVVVNGGSGGGTGTVTKVTATSTDGITATVTNSTVMPNIALGIADGSIALSKLAETVTPAPVLTPDSADTVTNKTIDGNFNTLQNIPFEAIQGFGTSILTLNDPDRFTELLWDNTAKTFDWVGTCAERGIAKQVWISPRTDGLAGIGTTSEPFDGSTSSKLDAIMADSAKTPANCAIHFLPGTFLTKGFVPRSGWRIYATPETTIKFDVLSAGEAAALSAPKIISMVGKTTNTLIQDLLIDGGTWDLNMQNQTQALCPGVVQVICDGFVARNMKVINFANTSPTAAECFVMGCFSYGSRDSIIHKRGTLWEDIEITQIASGVTNTGTITLINANGGQSVTDVAVLSNGWFEGVTVRNCYFHDITTADAIGLDCVNLGGWVKGFHAYGNRFSYMSGANARYGYYLDTGSVQDVKIENDQFLSVPSAVTFLSGTGWIQNNISISGEMIVSSNFIPINLNASTGTISNISLENNKIISPSGAGGIGINAVGITRLSIVRNTVDSATVGALTLSGGTTIASRFYNRQLDGTPVTGESGLGDLLQVQNTSVTTGTVVLVATKSVLQINAELTGALVITLPLATAVPAGSPVTILDSAGYSTGVNQVLVGRSGSDTINGGTSNVVVLGGQGVRTLYSDGISKWSVGNSLMSSPTNLTLDGGTNGTTFRTNGTDRFYINSSGYIIPLTSNTYDIGASGITFRDLFLSRNLNLSALTASQIAITDGSKNLASAGFASTDVARLSVANAFAANQTLSDVNLILGTTTGTKIGTATGQKIGFWNATPIVQPVFATGASHTVDELITLLQTLGLCKQA